MAARLQIRRTVVVPVRNVEAFRDVYFEGGLLGGIIAPLGSPVAVGEECELEVRFAAEGKVFHTRGVARWRRTTSQRHLPAGIGIELSPTERRTRDLMVGFASGKPVRLIERSQPRFPVEIEITYRSSAGMVTELTDNLSVGGCFIRSEQLPPLGEVLALQLRPPGFLLGIGVRAEVVWHQTLPTRTSAGAGGRGFGVRFVNLKKGTQKKLQELVARIQRQVEQELDQPL